MDPNESVNQPIVDAPTVYQSSGFKDKFKSLRSSHKLVLFFLLLFIPLSIVAFALWTKKLPTLGNYPPIPPSYLAVVSASPTGITRDSIPKIEVTFNLPVTAHHASEYFYITPIVEGQFSQGSTPNQIVFIPKVPFGPGTKVQVVLKEGLPSDSGKKLLYDYAFNFLQNYDPQDFTFTNNDWAAKFMSFDQSRGAEVYVQAGSFIQNPIVKVYKVDSNLVLNNLTYTTDIRDEESSYSYYPHGKYIEKDIDFSRLTQIKEIAVRENPDIRFQGETGLYLFQGFDGDVPMQRVWVSLNNIGIHYRQDDEKIYLAAQNFNSQEVESGISATFYQLKEQPIPLVTHSLSNIQEYPWSFNTRLDLIVAKKGVDTMIIPVKIPNTQADISSSRDLSTAYETFIYTDRPVYKKGAKVAFRGIVRRDNDALYQPANISRMRIYLDSYSNEGSKTIYDEEVSVNSGGIFSGEFTLPEDLRPGVRYIYAAPITSQNAAGSSFNYQNSGSAYFDVFEYIKPEFGLEAESSIDEATKGDKITSEFHGEYFNARPLSNQKVKLSIYTKDFYETEKAVYNSSFKLNGWGGMCGGGFSEFEEYYGNRIGEQREITLDANGNASFEFDTKELTSALSQELSFVIEKLDANNNKIVAANKVIVHQGEYNIFLRPSTTTYKPGDTLMTNFYVENTDGSRVDKDLTWEIYQESWSNNNNQEKKVLQTGTVKTSEGLGTVNERLNLADDNYGSLFFAINGSDSKGNKIEARKYLYLQSSANQYGRWNNPVTQTALKMVANEANLSVGEDSRISIEAPADMKVFVTFERGRIYNPQWLTLKKGQNEFVFPVVEAYAPSITPTFSYFYEGNDYIEGMSMNVPAMHKLVSVDISTDKERYNPGDTAVITLTTKDAVGNLISADLGVGIVDKAIFALRKNATSPLHSYFYYYRPRSVNSSSSLTWIATYDYGGKGGGGGGGEGFQKDSDTLYWDPTLKTGTDGQVTVNVPVGNTQTTWKILSYASTADTFLGQGELEFLVAD